MPCSPSVVLFALLQAIFLRVHFFKKIQDWICKSRESENGFFVSLLHESIQDLSDHGASKASNRRIRSGSGFLRFL